MLFRVLINLAQLSSTTRKISSNTRIPYSLSLYDHPEILFSSQQNHDFLDIFKNVVMEAGSIVQETSNIAEGNVIALELFLSSVPQPKLLIEMF